MSRNKSVDSPDSSPWLRVAGLVMWLSSLGRLGLSSLVKIDGLRDHGKTYTVLLDGPVDQGPAFRKNAGDLCELLDEAIKASSAKPCSPVDDDAFLRELADLIARADEIARDGSFVALRIDAGSEGGLYQVSMGGPLFGKAYFDESGADLVILMREALRFYGESRSS